MTEELKPIDVSKYTVTESGNVIMTYGDSYGEQFRQYEERITELKKENEELKAQIEKMKCCENCINHRFVGDCLECQITIDCANYEAWELRK